MRLIDADELKIDYGFTWDDITPTHDEMYALIDRQPTIESERKKGKWIRSGDELFPFECDQCFETNERTTPWCPHCGCKMEGEQP